MDQTKVKTTAGDFFIYLGVIIGLYVSTFSLINILFSLINKWLPDTTSFYNYDYTLESMRMALAALIIFFPVFIYLSRISTKAVAIIPEKKDLWVRRWFFFLTLFLTGLAMAVDLVTLVYRFIGGEDLTLRFLLKVLVVFLITFAVFRFYLYELHRDVTLPMPKRKYIMYATCVGVLAVIILGLVSIGSPSKQRSVRFDEQRVENLSSIQYAVTDYYRANDKLPIDLAILSQGTTYYISSLVDPETKADYEYRVVSTNKYEICATFSASNITENSSTRANYQVSDLWLHKAGRTCFEREAGDESMPIKI